MSNYTEALRNVIRLQNELLEAEKEAHKAWMEETA